MRKSIPSDDRRCYNCGELYKGVLFGKYDRLICYECMPLAKPLKKEKCCECNTEKDCTIIGSTNPDVKHLPIYVCPACIFKATQLT